MTLGQKSGAERRQHSRRILSRGQAQQVQLTYTPVQTGDGQPLSDADIVDISVGGIACGSSQLLPEETSIQLRLAQPPGADVPAVSGRVVWTSSSILPMYWYGVQFERGSEGLAARVLEILLA